MVQMPTGTGKTHLMAALINDQLRMGDGSLKDDCTQVLVVVHRRELISQISQTLDGFGVEHGLIVSGKETDYSQRVQVASIQTLARRCGHTGDTDAADGLRSKKGRTDGASTLHFSLIIIDEAHHALAKTYRQLWEWWPRARFLGLTATPCRLSSAPFTDLFQVLLQSWPIQQFIDKGWLSDFEYVSAAPDSEALRRVRSLKRRGADGDYQPAELATVMDVPESTAHLYKTYRQFAGGKKGIVYAIDRQHAQHIAEYYASQGVKCAVIDSKTSAVCRQQALDDFRQQTTDVLVNVDIFSEGFDCPEVEFIQLARPTLSLSKYLQQVGRGMRVSPGKPHVLILDNVGLYQTFGLPTEERDWRQTFYGLASGRGDTTGGRYVVLDEPHCKSFPTSQRELVNLEMVRIKKGGKKRAGLEIFLKDGRYGVLNNGRVSCQPRFKEIVRLHDQGGFFAAGVYGGLLSGSYVEYASLIDRKGMDRGLRLFREVEWKDGIYFSYYLPKGYKKGDDYWHTYWDPKGNCYYDEDPEFRRVAGVEVAQTYEHEDRNQQCRKLRCSTGSLSPRFHIGEMYFNKDIVIARDYLIVKRDKNHAYRICGFLGRSVVVRKEDMPGYQQIGLDGRKGEEFRDLPPGMTRITPVSYLHYQRDLGLHSPHVDRHTPFWIE